MPKNIRSMTLIVLITTMLLAGSGSIRAANASDYQLIVNESSPVTSLRADDVKRIMMGKTTRWDHGVKVQPVDQTQNSATRAVFSKEILRKSISAVKAYWQSQIFSGRGVPPTELRSDKEVVDFVRQNPGAIGYVASGTRLQGVRSVGVQF